jgi:hypothetical protein
MPGTQDCCSPFQATPGVTVDLSQLEAMKRQFEQAVEELRRLRDQNAELQRGYGKVAGASAERDMARGEELAWEEQREQWLHRWQNPAPAPARIGPAAGDDSPGGAHAYQALQSKVAELEAQIRQLHAQLAEKSAVDKVLDADAVIQEERARLAELKEEWEEKLRLAELEASRERAELTRTRLVLEERARTLEAIKERFERSQDRTSRATWRDYLGLPTN